MTLRAGWMFSGLLVAFSPVLFNLAENLHNDPRDAYTLLPIALILRRLVDTREQPAAETWARLGPACLGLGVAAELIGIVSGSWSIARLGLPLAFVGTALWTGRPAPATALLAIGLVPIPASLLVAGSPALESALLEGATALYRALGMSLAGRGPLVMDGDARFELFPADAGWVTASVLFQAGWYRALIQASSPRRRIGSAIAGGVVGFCLQPVLLVAAVGIFALGAPSAARFLLTQGVWLSVALIALVGPYFRRRVLRGRSGAG